MLFLIVQAFLLSGRSRDDPTDPTAYKVPLPILQSGATSSISLRIILCRRRCLCMPPASCWNNSFRAITVPMGSLSSHQQQLEAGLRLCTSQRKILIASFKYYSIPVFCKKKFGFHAVFI